MVDMLIGSFTAICLPTINSHVKNANTSDITINT